MAAADQQPVTTVTPGKKGEGKTKTILIIAATVILAGIAIFTAVRLYQLRQQAVAPTAPESVPEALAPCVEECPDAEGILRDCTPPDQDGTSEDSVCYPAVEGRVETCGGIQFCCSPTTVSWITNMAPCTATTPPDDDDSSLAGETSTPTSTPTGTPTSTPTGTPTSTPTTALPEAGISYPTIISISAGILLIIVSLVLAL